MFFQLIIFVHTRFGDIKQLVSKIKVLVAKYNSSNSSVSSVKQLSEKLCKKDLFCNLNDTPNVPCIVGNKIYLGNKYFAEADQYTDEEKVLICIACYYIRNISYPAEYDVFMTLIQIRIFNDMTNITQNIEVDNIIALL
jgi:hypothetical protein